MKGKVFTPRGSIKAHPFCPYAMRWKVKQIAPVTKVLLMWGKILWMLKISLNGDRLLNVVRMRKQQRRGNKTLCCLVCLTIPVRYSGKVKEKWSVVECNLSHPEEMLPLGVKTCP